MIAWFARNSVAANLLMVTIILAGILSMKTELTLDVFPSADPDTVRVSVALRGATPEDIELGVATRIEQAVQDLEGIDQITSTSVEGATTVVLEIDSDYDPRDILDDIKSRVDSINTFPADAEKPVVSLAIRKFSVIEVVIAGNYGELEILQQAEKVRDDLLRVEGITQVEISSVRNYEIAVEASQNRLREFDLTLEDLSSAIRSSSVDLSAGNLRTAGGDVLIRAKGQAYSRTDFESIVVKTNVDGSIIRLKDVATVDDSFEEESVRTRFNGNPAAFIRVYRVGTQSAIGLADKVKAYIDQRQATLPVGISLSYWDDDSQLLRDRLGILMSSALQGAALVILLLTLFLRPAIAIWVFIGIPVSFLGAIFIMGTFGISLNIMSAFAFIVVLGIVVDDAIVTGENVYTHLRDGNDGLTAAIEGTREVSIPVTFGVLTTMVAFAPLALIEGHLGRVFSPIPAVVIPVLVFSLIESKLVLPAHLKHIKLRSQNNNPNAFQRWQKSFADGFENNIRRLYLPLLKRATNHRYATLAAFVGCFILILALLASGWSRFTFFPRFDGETATAKLTMPVGTPFAVTDRFIQQISEAAKQMQSDHHSSEDQQSPITNILAVTGSGGGRSTNSSNVGIVQFEVTPKEQRSSEITTTALVNEWRRKIGQIPGAESLTFRAAFFRPGNPIDIQLSGNSLAELSEIGEKIKQRLTTYPSVYEIADSLSDGKEELHIELTDQGHVLGLTRSNIVGQVGQAFKGLEAQRIQRGRDDIRVLVRFPQQERSAIDGLNEMLITTPSGSQVPLSHVALLRPDKGPSQITRIDLFRVLNVTAEVDKDKVNMTVLQADISSYLDELLLQYPSVSYSLEGEAKQQRESFGSLQSGLIAVVFAIYCLLALPLRSYIQPLIVMSVIPFGLIGAVIGHWLLGHDLSILSILGLMALLGVLVNDSLVLVDYINQRIKAGDPLQEAVLNAGVARFRPVFLTSMTTFFGLMPLMMETSATAQFLIPMAISLGFGILFATLVTLIMVPTNILIVDDLRQLLRRLTSSKPRTIEEH
jgi:multidrug efflux pump subunit AcrB